MSRYNIDGNIFSIWTSSDLLVLKMIALKLGEVMKNDLLKTCYHVKDHGGLKKGVVDTVHDISNYTYVMRSDIKSYYESIRFDVLMGIIEQYVQDPILLKLLYKALHRTETMGGLFYDYDVKGLPLGSPLSPLLGAIALMPLDLELKNMKNVFYARYMDDWCVLTKTKSALRKVVKKTHKVMKHLKLTLHPTKTYIGKISKGFNFLGYFFDHNKLLPSMESIRRMRERATQYYVQPFSQSSSQNGKKHSKKFIHKRDISEYYVNEKAPQKNEMSETLNEIFKNPAVSLNPLVKKDVALYLKRWFAWLILGIDDNSPFLQDWGRTTFILNDLIIDDCCVHRVDSSYNCVVI